MLLSVSFQKLGKARFVVTKTYLLRIRCLQLHIYISLSLSLSEEKKYHCMHTYTYKR